jgi:hypothetical protein
MSDIAKEQKIDKKLDNMMKEDMKKISWFLNINTIFYID